MGWKGLRKCFRIVRAIVIHESMMNYEIEAEETATIQGHTFIRQASLAAS